MAVACAEFFLAAPVSRVSAAHGLLDGDVGENALDGVAGPCRAASKESIEVLGALWTGAWTVPHREGNTS